MFSNWFSGDDLERYRRSPHKQRIDAIASSLLRLKYASEVIRQHLHEWLRFSRTLDTKGHGAASAECGGCAAVRGRARGGLQRQPIPWSLYKCAAHRKSRCSIACWSSIITWAMSSRWASI